MRPKKNQVEVSDRPGSRRSAITEASLELFATRGYRETTMADIGERVGIRGPSLYKHVSSKQELLAEIMVASMNQLLANHKAAIETTTDIREQLRRAVEAHARYRARHRYEAFLGTREVENLEEPDHTLFVRRRAKYEQGFRELIESGRQQGIFEVESPTVASMAILDMGIGLSVWYSPNGPLTVDEIAYVHGDIALRIVGCRTSELAPERR